MRADAGAMLEPAVEGMCGILRGEIEKHLRVDTEKPRAHGSVLLALSAAKLEIERGTDDPLGDVVEREDARGGA
jgi:hypothetical protein